MSIRTALLLLPLLSLAPAAASARAAGDLDPTFDGDGKRFVPLSSSTDRVNAVAVDVLGRVVGVGTTRSATTGDDWSVIRLLPDGTPDPSFGGGDGVVVLALSADDDKTYDVVLQPDGRIVVGGDSGDDVAIVRLLANGDLDPSFGGGDGRFDHSTAPGFAADTLHALVLQPDGAVVGAGYGSDAWDLWALRVDPAGELDATFGTGGVAWVSPGVDAAYLRDAALDADGHLVLAGSYDGFHQLLVARLDENGDLDASFGGDGMVVLDLGAGTVDAAEAVVVLPDGRLVVGGRVDRSTPTRDDLLVLRLESDGDLDPSYGGGDGWVALDAGTSGDDGDMLAVDAAGRAVMVGNTDSYQPALARSVVARFTAAGEPDPDFGGGDGFVLHDLAPGDSEDLYGLATLADGRIVAAGRSPRTGQSTGYDSVFVRLSGGCLFCDGFETGDDAAWTAAP